MFERLPACALAPLALAACSGAALPEAPPPAAAPTVTPSPAPPPRLGLLEIAPDPPAVPLSEGPLPAYPGRFAQVPLPPGIPALAAVAGRDDRDVWMVARGGAVLRWDGARITRHGTPRYFADACCGRVVDCARWPAKCRAPQKPCDVGDPSCALAVDFDGISLTPGGVGVVAVVDTGGMTRSVVEARRDEGGRWSCEQADDPLLRPGSEDIAAGGATLRFESPAIMVNPIGGFSILFEGRRLSLPEGGELGFSGGLAARAIDDLWLWSGARIWRGNGLAWDPIPTALDYVAAMWIADPGSVWALGSTKQGANDELDRWGPEGALQQRFATPGATQVLKKGGPTFWLAGKKALYHWDGRALRRVEAPVDETAGHVWLAPSGELWVVGGGPAGGAAFRLLPGDGTKP